MSDSALAALACAVDSEEVGLLLVQKALPEAYREDLREHIAPIASALAQRARAAEGPVLVGINGCQGSGKSTLARFLGEMLRIGAGLRCVTVSIDDFYLDKHARQTLAQSVHGLLATRGVPGTHDLTLANATLDALLDPLRESEVCVPVFNKATDEREPTDAWLRVPPAPDVVILEGWCVGCPPEKPEDLLTPINALEQNEDADGGWRQYVNAALSNDYPPFFERLDVLIMLAAPSFECVFKWREKQEKQLAETLTPGNDRQSESLLFGSSLRRFIHHFERLTKHQLRTLPQHADAVVSLASNHRMVAHSGSLIT